MGAKLIGIVCAIQAVTMVLGVAGTSYANEDRDIPWGIWAGKPTRLRVIQKEDCTMVTEFADGRPSIVERPLVFGSGNKPRAITYREPETGITIYAGSDGRHITAKTEGGKVLWVRDPFTEAHLCPYRSAHPIIFSIGPSYTGVYLNKRPLSMAMVSALLKEPKFAKVLKHSAQAKVIFVPIHFDSSQFGELDIRTGEFFDEGQN